MLEPIIEATTRRVADLHTRRDEVRAAAEAAGPVRGFRASLAAPGLQVVAEIKRRSPSAGVLRADLDPVQRASAYERGGAAAISVLTEPDFFAGSNEDLVSVRSAVALPVLRKDFVIDPLQVWEARSIGADAVLLIVAILDDAMMRECLDAARSVGVDALVEAHTTIEAEAALSAGADLIGVNNRDLGTFVTDLAVSERAAQVFEDVTGGNGLVTIAESGVSNPEGASRMAAAGYDAVLVGEALVRSEQPAALLTALRGVP